MSRHLVFVFALLLALFAGFVERCSAQGFYGSVVGSVVDSSGSAIASATVTLTNVGTAERSTAMTDAAGNYQFLNLVPSVYKVDIEQPGFKHLTRDQIQVRVNDASRVNATLELGQISQTVEVTSQATLLQTESATVSQVVEGRQVQDTPLNGRNVLDLIALVPGAVAGGGSGGFPLNNNAAGSGTSSTGFGNFQIGGGISSQNAIFIDGSQNGLSGNNTPVLPTQDSIQEFSVATNSVSPEFGGFGGGVISMTTKSGTNAFHGTAYEFLRNKVLNANNFFANKNGISTLPFTQNQYGTAVGGPVIRNRTFFFGSWEGFAVRQGVTQTLTVPTAAFRAGDFSGQPNIIYDPSTTTVSSTGQVSRTPFQNNQIPIADINPTAMVMLNYWALPNRPGTINNYIVGVPVGGNSNQTNDRVDHIINDKQRIFARYTWWKETNVKTDPMGTNTGANLFSGTNNQFVLGYTYALSPTLILEGRAAYTRQNAPQVNESYPADLSKFGPAWAAIASQITGPSFPAESITGGFYPFSGSVSTSRDNDYFYSLSLTKTVGRHTLKFGGNFKRDLAANRSNKQATGTFNFDSTFTSANATAASSSGLGFADFLLGYPTTGSMTNTSSVYTTINAYGFYLTDTYQIHPKVTLNIGLRWEQPGSDGELYNHNLVFNVNQLDPIGPAAGLPNLVGQPCQVATVCHPSGLERSLHWTAFSPRVGLAYRMDSKTVIRTGFGINYLPYLIGAYGTQQATLNLPSTPMVTTLNGGQTPAPGISMSNPFPNGLLQQSYASAAFQALEGSALFADLPNQPLAYMMQWNFNIQRDLGHDMMVQAGYAANAGRHLGLSVNSGVQLDQIPDTAVAQYGSSLLTQVPNPFFGVLPASVGVLGQKTVALGYLLKPFPQFLSVATEPVNQGISNYQSLQLTFQKRFKSGGTIVANYTWSKFLADVESATSTSEAALPGWIQNWSNYRANYSLEATNPPRRLSINYSYDLPFGKGRRFLSSANAIEDHLIGGWTVSGVSTFSDGLPLSMTALPNSLSSLFNASWSSSGFSNAMRPNVVAGCNSSISGSATSRLSQWFDTACYTQPGSLSFGDASRTDPRLSSQGILNFDAAANKMIALNERWNLQFRGEFFNLANRVQFAAPNTQVGNPNFGVVTATYPFANPRLIQLSLRLRF